MKKKIDVTSWYEVLDYILSNSENKKEKNKRPCIWCTGKNDKRNRTSFLYGKVE